MGRRQAARDAVTFPAIVMIGLGILGFGVLTYIELTYKGDPAQQGNSAYKAGRYTADALMFIWSSFVTLGGVLMFVRRFRQIVAVAAVFAMLPCNMACLFGIPVGIWVLVTLKRPEVEDAFY